MTEITNQNDNATSGDDLTNPQHPLRIEYRALLQEQSASYTSAFPNPRNPVYARYLAARRAVDAFEAAHPEVLAAIAAAKAAKTPAAPEPGSLLDRVLRGVD